MSDWHRRMRQQKASGKLDRNEQAALATARADEQVRKFSAIRRLRNARPWRELGDAILVALHLR